DRGDHGAVLGGDHEGRLVDQDERRAGALRGRAVDALAEAGLVDGDAALLDPLERVPAVGEAAELAGEHVAEAGGRSAPDLLRRLDAFCSADRIDHGVAAFAAARSASVCWMACSVVSVPLGGTPPTVRTSPGRTSS